MHRKTDRQDNQSIGYSSSVIIDSSDVTVGKSPQPPEPMPGNDWIMMMMRHGNGNAATATDAKMNVSPSILMQGVRS
jgi:hypothetical protein